ncbi:hypothetical protein FEM48_Zijuj08G0167900 [Ziziphus jujuba var. spinosa]|uniref:Uncharacterized protein n=1 Tax=Ziziphus jujuba var. spinosa TaxID=714518 RepID=A0A978V086_ZIZJJ|nr:hypothetical protein FEM48_Zijuj08G0167900 [Ziziphus jujuba var. spinosa]
MLRRSILESSLQRAKNASPNPGFAAAKWCCMGRFFGSLSKSIDKEAVEEVKAHREIPDIKPGYIMQLNVEVAENKRHVSILKGIVIARCNAGLNITFRIRRLVAGVGVESLFPLYSPNIKEIKVLD